MKQQNNYELSDDEYARWLCLFEAVNFVADVAEKKGINIHNTNAWINPMAFNKYISERYLDKKYEMDHLVNEPAFV